MTPAGLGVLQIEPTDHCNLSCRMCAPHHERWEQVHGIPKGFLQMPLFRQIIDGLVAERCNFDHLILQWLGDPSLHPELEAMVGYAGRQMAGLLGYLRFDSNGILLDERRMERLIAEKHPEMPLLVVFTVDAASPEVYTQVKGRDALARVRRHIRALMRLRRSQHNLHLQVQFVVQPQNAHEVLPFLNYWQDAWACQGTQGGHFEILFKRLSVGGGAQGQAAADDLYQRSVYGAGVEAIEKPGLSVQLWENRPWQRDDAHARRGACPGLWFTPVIRQDGALLMCCADLQGSLSLGSLAQQSFRSLWEGPQANRLRLEHLRGHFTGPCVHCGGVNWYQLGPAQIEATLAHSGISL
jgi:hypothetical protein